MEKCESNDRRIPFQHSLGGFVETAVRKNLVHTTNDVYVCSNSVNSESHFT